MSDCYQKVAYIGLRNPDGTYMINVPLYIKVKEVTKNGVSIMQEEMIHKISEIMMKHYEKQIVEKMKTKQIQGEENETL